MGHYIEDVAAQSVRLKPLEQAEEDLAAQLAGNRTALRQVRLNSK
jgi:hypothetical protein